ncbi:hypothetical protein TNCV_2138281 [Trichonephila clavipes]|nr:hypothetical protein TNCV_2138281 [Trichonephila clavipes]
MAQNTGIRYPGITVLQSLAAMEDLTTRIDVTSVDIASIFNLFERIQQSFIHRCQLCRDPCSRTTREEYKKEYKK